MPTPTIPYKIIVEDSFQEHWPTDKGMEARITYECAWADRFEFMLALRGGFLSTATSFGAYVLPHAYPPLPYLYCCEIESVKGSGLVKGADPADTKWAPFAKARVVARYEPPKWNQQSSETSQSIDQDDPPLLFCKMDVKASASFRTLPEGALHYATTVKPVRGSAGVPETQTEISLEFPMVPFNPYVAVKPWLGLVNSVPMFGHDKGEVLFDSVQTSEGAHGNSAGTPTGIDRSCTLSFLARQVSWRQLLMDDGTYEPVLYNVSNKPIFQATNLWNIFDASVTAPVIDTSGDGIW